MRPFMKKPTDNITIPRPIFYFFLGVVASKIGVSDEALDILQKVVVNDRSE